MRDRDGAATAGALEQRIGYEFSNSDLLTTALTHSSAVNDAMASYQRLEFLGDRVLALVISEMLIEAFPRAAEGELAQRLTALVRNEACAEVARALDLGEAIRLGGGEAQSGGRRKAAILGDACEALIGAVYLDGGLEPAATFLQRELKDAIDGGSERLFVQDYKSALQERVQALGRPLPEYRVSGESGPDHHKIFSVDVVVSGEVLGSATGRAKKEAEQDAARQALLRLDAAS